MRVPTWLIKRKNGEYTNPLVRMWGRTFRWMPWRREQTFLKGDGTVQTYIYFRAQS